MNHTIQGGAYVRTFLAAGLLMMLSIAPVAADGVGHESPCAGISVLPPVAHIDPACIETGEARGNGMITVDPVLDGLGAVVDWRYAGESEDVKRFYLFRGETPMHLDLIASVANTEATYVDDWRAFDAGEVWYAVGARMVDSEQMIMSDAYLLQVSE